jgi:hypothetical protein
VVVLLAWLLVVPGGAAQPSAKHFLWSVTNSGGAVAHLVGSLHVLTPDFYPLAAEIEQAFTASKVLVEEVDLDETGDPTSFVPMMAKAVFNDGGSLERVVSPATFAEVRTRAEKAGVPLQALQRMKPWMAAVALTVPILQAAGFDPNLGVDRHFFDEAKSRGMERRGLEGVASQLDRFNNLSPALQEQLLKTTLAELDTQVANVKDVATAWASGDTAALERLLLAAMRESPELYQRLLVERNQNWLPLIDACLQRDARCFIVVGAAHLVGPDGLPALLQKKGYRVEQR